MAGTCIRLVVLGAGGVGKSALTLQYVRGVFVDKYDPTIEDSYQVQAEIDGEGKMIEVLDTAGSEQFTTMRQMYMKHGNGFVLVYSIDLDSTFSEIKEVLDSISHVKDSTDFPAVLIGNKIDLEHNRIVQKKAGEQLASAYGNCAFIETSAKKRLNVTEAFNLVIRKCMKKDSKQPQPKKKNNGCTLF